ncbi:MAG TPA: UDP-4-amino-4,6-dideoxy-N-acetyl-beta-L-altrosamine transaminase [Methylomirabilota bacterium]|nr:UDP-4-amino-4,6-dideoxy-N-acetyl-beta-L-altrosamine transaminase [Methylomirabilota bacterium]
MTERLARHGGVPVRATTLPYCRQTIDDDDVQAVLATLRSDWLTTGPRVEGFEHAVATLLGVAHAVAVNSGTAALHAAVFAAGIGPGDEVVTSPLTFVASANAVLYCGGKPVFADVQGHTLNLDPAAVEAACTERTRAILHVDYAGQPGDIDELAAIARRRGLILIEDAAHALGAEYRGRRIGSAAELTTFSFHPAKAVTTGEGGMVTTNLPDLAARVRRFRNHGLASDFRERGDRGDVYSPMVDLGFNYRLTDFQCALGLSQLGRLEHFLKRRSEIADRYRAAFEPMPGVAVPRVEPHVRHAWHIFPVLLEVERLSADRREVLAALRAEGIGATVHYVPAYWHPYYQRLGYPKGLCPVAEQAFERLVTLPIFPGMTDQDAEDVVNSLRKVLGYYTR